MKKLTCLMALGLMMVGFQNCSKVAFENMRGDLAGKTGFAAGAEIIDVVDKEIIVKDEVVTAGDDVVSNDDEVKKNDEVKQGDGDDDSKESSDVADDDKVVLDEEDLEMFACAEDGKKDHKVMICHNDKGDGKRRSQCIDKHALQAHLAHSKDGHVDNLGACPGETLARRDKDPS